MTVIDEHTPTAPLIPGSFVLAYHGIVLSVNQDEADMLIAGIRSLRCVARRDLAASLFTRWCAACGGREVPLAADDPRCPTCRSANRATKRMLEAAEQSTSPSV